MKRSILLKDIMHEYVNNTGTRIISSIVNGVRVRKMYIGYTKEEAITKFINEQNK